MVIGDLPRTRPPVASFGRSLLWSLAIIPVPALFLAGWLALPVSEGRAHSEAAAVPESLAVAAASSPRTGLPAPKPEPVQTDTAPSAAPAAEKGSENTIAVSSVEPMPSASQSAPAPMSLFAPPVLPVEAPPTTTAAASAPETVKPASKPAYASKPPSSDVTGAVADPSQTRASSGNRAEPGLVDLNNGSFEQLNSLRGAGPIGRAIIRGRPYASVEELVTKRVLRRSVYEQVKDQVTVE